MRLISTPAGCCPGGLTIDAARVAPEKPVPHRPAASTTLRMLRAEGQMAIWTPDDEYDKSERKDLELATSLLSGVWTLHGVKAKQKGPDKRYIRKTSPPGPSSPQRFRTFAPQ